ncbi:MAG: 4-hydroxy-tetrahydrodipicolinate reductase [Ruminococcaceae bacterium]|nr:4-hydroxy-tetrahydrodipicolinate reductase [Oscillospiraceae bacterium]
MIKAILVGACGKMGKNITECAAENDDIKIVAGVDKYNSGMAYPVFSDFSKIDLEADVIIDFSNPALLNELLEFAKSKKLPLVIATTGYNESQIKQIEAASKFIPIFFTFNMSLGVNLLCSLAKRAASILGDDFDIEIIEKHHNQKLDSPSGTAIMLANALNGVFNDKLKYEYDRHTKRAKRNKNEIGIHSVRGGTIVGEHDVIFAGRDEVITLSHAAHSKQVFAVGALRAAKFIATKPNGMYDMNDILKID